MRPLVVFAVLIGAVALGAWMLWPDGGTPEQNKPTTTVVNAGEPTGSTRRLPVSNQGGSGTDRSGDRSVAGGLEMGRPGTPAVNPTPTPVRREPTPDEAAGWTNASDPNAADPTRGAAETPIVRTPEVQRPAAPPVRPRNEAQAILAVADRALAENRPVDAREELNRALHAVDFTDAERDAFRMKLSEINEALFFSPSVTPGDPLVFEYTVKSGDMLINIVRREKSQVDWRFITRINRISDPGKIRVGQSIKLVRGPLHAVVDKSSYRLDLYADQTDGKGNRFYLRSFPVGLGEYDSTPLGAFVVRDNSKLINPRWVNPRTGEVFAADNPANPIGERWVGLEGTDPGTAALNGYGIHGTIEPTSIGKQASMGCVRMLSPDVELIYEVLIEQASTVRIVP